MKRSVSACCAALLLSACMATVQPSAIVDAHDAHVGIQAPADGAGGGAGPASPPQLEVYIYPRPEAEHRVGVSSSGPFA